MNKLVNAIDQVVEENNLPHEWSKEIVAELKDLEHKKEPKNRVDLRSHPFVTIDGKDAKDFDDAVFCKEELNGFMLQVAIADVADIVKQGTELVFEALKRGTSI